LQNDPFLALKRPDQLQIDGHSKMTKKKGFTTQNTKECYKFKINAQIDKYKVENY
jgi:hypothetical protein